MAYQVGDGPAHGSYVAGAGLRDEFHEPVPLLAVVAAHRRDHGPHPVDRHGIRRGVYKGRKPLPGQAGDGERRRMVDHRHTAAALQECGNEKYQGFENENPFHLLCFPPFCLKIFRVLRRLLK